jgi:phosphinothricin acetyltransferase
MIRLAKALDLDGIFSIYDQQVLHGIATFETVPKTHEERQGWFEAHPPAKYPALIATQDGGDGSVLGWAGLSPWSPRPAYARTAENSVYVHEAWRGKGLGKLLMRELIAMALRDTPVRVMVARIAQPSPGSVALHTSLGFKPVGTLRRCGEKFGRILDVLIMELHLDQKGQSN